MSTLYIYKCPFPKRFSDYLASLGYDLTPRLLAITDQLGALTPRWHWQAKEMLVHVTPDQADSIFQPIIEAIKELANLGLGMNPPWSVLNACWLKNRGRFPKRHDFCIHAYQLIDTIGQHLLIHRLEGSGVTNHVRRLIKQHRENGPEKINFGRVENGYKEASKLNEERAAERMARLEGTRSYYMLDCGYLAINWTMTPPPHLNSGYGNKQNPAWVEAGKPVAHDAHTWLHGKFRMINDLSAKRGHPLKGYRTVESFKNGVPHWAGQFFCPPDHADWLNNTMRRIMYDEKVGGQSRGGFKKSGDQALVSVVTDDYENASTWSNYVDKYCNGHPEKPNGKGGKGGEFDTFTDEDYSFLWGHDQYQFFGQQPIQNWRSFKKLDRRQLEDDSFRSQLPKTVLDAWHAASGTQVIDGKLVSAKFDYRAFLRITEPETATHRLNQSNGGWTPLPALSFKHTRLIDGSTHLSLLVAGSNVDISTTLKKPVAKEIELNDLEIFSSRFVFYTFPQLCIRLPTDQAETPPDPPDKPPAKRFYFKRR